MSSASTPATTFDPFFEVVHDGEWNACVGIQGNDINYVDGYMEAARELVGAVIDKRMVASRDTLAMPILYKCRHALELALKFVINRLHRVGMIAEHHLAHWQHLQRGVSGDAQLVALIAELEPFVVSLAGIDEDGQELRYSRTRDGAKSLGGIAIVNLPLIRASIEELAGKLDRLKYRVFALEEERTTGTHTKECSRADLEQIASMLGDDASWRDPDFVDKQKAVMERFGLSRRKFSMAVDAIRKSRPLAARLGLETDLAYLSDEKAVAAVELWTKAHPVREHAPDDLGTDYFDRDWEKFKEHAQTARKLDVAIEALLTIEELSDLEVLFYVGRDRVQGEHYEVMLADTVEKHRSEPDRWAGVHHLMTKTTLLDCVVDGAAAVGRPSLAVKLRSLRPLEAPHVGDA